MPIESRWIFYPKYVADVVTKHMKLIGMIWHFGRFRYQLKGDPQAASYTDRALTPVAPGEIEPLESFTILEPAGANPR